MTHLEVIRYSGVEHVYDGMRCVGWAFPGTLHRRFACGTFEEAEELCVRAKSDADVIDCLVALSGQR